MIDTNAYRARIGTFSMPGQRKFKVINCKINEKKSWGFSSSFLHLLLLSSTLIYLKLSLDDQQSIFWGHAGWKHETLKSEETLSLHKQSISRISSDNNWYARYTLWK
jgi:hypothetical protein